MRFFKKDTIVILVLIFLSIFHFFFDKYALEKFHHESKIFEVIMLMVFTALIASYINFYKKNNWNLLKHSKDVKFQRAKYFTILIIYVLVILDLVLYLAGIQTNFKTFQIIEKLFTQLNLTTVKNDSLQFSQRATDYLKSLSSSKSIL